MQIRKFKWSIFFSLFVMYGMLTVITLLAAFAEDEGNIGTNPIFLILAKLFYVFRFPTHTLLWNIMVKSGSFAPLTFFGGLIINCFCYAFLTERIFYLTTKTKVAGIERILRSAKIIIILIAVEIALTLLYFYLQPQCVALAPDFKCDTAISGYQVTILWAGSILAVATIAYLLYLNLKKNNAINKL